MSDIEKTSLNTNKTKQLNEPDIHDELIQKDIWIKQANCRYYPTQLFFPHNGEGVIQAQKICADCPVKKECLEYAIEHSILYGVWGGTSERERRRMRSKVYQERQPTKPLD